MSDVPVRSFLAVEIPDPVRRSIAEATRRWRPRFPRATWVRPENLHLTVKFLGEVGEGRLRRLGDALEPVLAPLPAVTVRLAGSGCFPPRGRARVGWIGGEAEGLGAVVAAVEGTAAKIGFERERRRWSLHLTVARPRDPWLESDAAAFRELGEELDLPAFTAREVVLFASELRPGGAVYTPLRSFPLT